MNWTSGPAVALRVAAILVVMWAVLASTDEPMWATVLFGLWAVLCALWCLGEYERARRKRVQPVGVLGQPVVRIDYTHLTGEDVDFIERQEALWTDKPRTQNLIYCTAEACRNLAQHFPHDEQRLNEFQMEVLTQADYDALPHKDPSTMYVLRRDEPLRPRRPSPMRREWR